MPHWLVIGGSITGGGGTYNKPNLAWPALLDAQLTVLFKNAVGPDYFLQCPQNFMPARNQIDGVIYDFGPNMFGKTAALSLATLINTTRHLTNSDTAAIVAWPRLDNKQDLRQSVLAAEMAHATLIEVEHNRSLYFDAVHPNLKGHAEIARAVDQYLRSAQQVARTRSNNHSRAFMIQPVEAPQFDASNQSNQTSEFCFHNASRLPVVEHTADWSLVEEGYGRISKQGWRTSTVGGLLHLALPRLRTCGAVVTLGFQRTNTSGVFELGCRHCSCVAQRHFFQDPFPIVRTRTRQAMRVTAMTTFTALLTSADHACVLRVNHTEGPTIRIDSLHVHEPTAQEALRSKRSLSNKAQQAFGRHALQTTACDSIVVETS